MSDTPDMSEDGNKQNLFDFDRSKGNFSFPERHKFNAGYGLTEATIDYICDVKDDRSPTSPEKTIILCR